MFTMLFTSLFPVVLKIFGWFFDRAQASADAEKAFLEFVNKMQATGLVSAKLNQDYQDQYKRLTEGDNGKSGT